MEGIREEQRPGAAPAAQKWEDADSRGTEGIAGQHEGRRRRMLWRRGVDHVCGDWGGSGVRD